MKTTVIPFAPLPSLSQSRPARPLVDYGALMKPRVMLLAVFTAFVGFAVAPIHPSPLSGFLSILGIAVGAGAAGVLNMWYDADIDALMARTARRPIPRGGISRGQALAFGLVLACSAVTLLGIAANLQAAALLAFTIFFYAVVYTMWLKRETPQNIVIGGAAGALPPIIGWTAATGGIGLEPFVLFLVIFLWTPPHFWALALNRSGEYACAGVPMLPVVAGKAATARQVFVYSALLVPISLLPPVFGFAGEIYTASAVVCGAIFLSLAVRLRRSNGADRKDASRLFVFSICYLFILFVALLLDHGGAPQWSSLLSFRGVTVGSVQPQLMQRALTASNLVRTKSGGV